MGLVLAFSMKSERGSLGNVKDGTGIAVEDS